MTTDHGKIKKWVEERRGKPQKIDAPGVPDTPGLRVDFPGREDDVFLSSGKKGRDISWEEFFAIFEEEKLSFMYDNSPAADLSLSYRFANRTPPEKTEMTEDEVREEEEEISGPP